MSPDYRTVRFGPDAADDSFSGAIHPQGEWINTEFGKSIGGVTPSGYCWV